MGIKDNLEKAADLFDAPSETSCVLMTEGAKDKMVNDSFDITKHEFTDYDVCVDYLGGANKDYLIVDTSLHMPVVLNKSDAIAIAKSLGVTGEDLK